MNRGTNAPQAPGNVSGNVKAKPRTTWDKPVTPVVDISRVTHPAQGPLSLTILSHTGLAPESCLCHVVTLAQCCPIGLATAIEMFSIPALSNMAAPMSGTGLLSEPLGSG